MDRNDQLFGTNLDYGFYRNSLLMPAVNWKHLDFEVQQKYLCSTILEQAWAKSCLRTTYGPPRTLMWPANTFQNLKIDCLDWLNSSFLRNVFLLMLVILARIHRINFKCGLRNKKKLSSPAVEGHSLIY